MSYIHYWVKEGTEETNDGTLSVTTHKCQCCGLVSNQFLQTDSKRGYQIWTEYLYPNGDVSEVYDASLPNPCPIKEWDLGTWLPGAIEI